MNSNLPVIHSTCLNASTKILRLINEMIPYRVVFNTSSLNMVINYIESLRMGSV